MEKLIEVYGPLPFIVEDPVELVRCAFETRDRLTSGDSTITEWTLEDLLVLETMVARLERIYNWIIRDKPPDCPPIRFPFDFDEWPTTSRNLTLAIVQIKESIFRKTTTDSCLSCLCILENIGIGAEMNWEFDDSRDPGYSTRSHLCAVDYSPDFPLLKRRSLDGCSLCEFIRQRLLGVRGEDGNEVGVWIEFFWGPREPTWVEQMWQRDRKGPGIRTHRLMGATISLTSTYSRLREVETFKVESDDDAVRFDLGLSPLPRKSPLDPGNVDFIQRHLGMDDNAHDGPASFLPRRLLDVGHASSSAKIVEVSLLPEPEKSRLKYASLSYCWGDQKQAAAQPKLLDGTADRFFKTINPTELTPVMIDAVTVCRVLHIRYLWIDALCIFQDSTTDWEEQSLQIGDIYGHARLVICTPSSSSCTEGFLQPRPMNSRFHYISRLQPSAHVQGYWSLRPLREASDRNYRHPLLQDSLSTRYFERGWSFQERNQGMRKLYFGTAMIHYQNENLSVSENGIAIRLDPNIIGIEFQDHAKDTQSIRTSLKSTNSIYGLWISLAVAVSFKKWTFRSDVLPGISGLADHFSKEMQIPEEEYLAGHWKGDLACSMIWVSGGDTDNLEDLLAECDRARDPSQGSYPSWSWAREAGSGISAFISRQCLVCCRVRSHVRSEFTLLESRVVVDGINPYGRLKSASLLISGRVINLSSKDHRLEKDGLVYIDDFILFLRTDWTSNAEYKKSIRSLRLLLVSSCCSDWPDRDPPRHNDLLDKKFWTLYRNDYERTYLTDQTCGAKAAQERCVWCQDPQRRRDIWGLLIYPTDATCGKYYRVGTFLSRAGHGGSEIFREADEHTLELI